MLGGRVAVGRQRVPAQPVRNRVDRGGCERLEAVSRRLAASLRDVQRARIVLAAAEGLENVVIAERVGLM